MKFFKPETVKNNGNNNSNKNKNNNSNNNDDDDDNDDEYEMYKTNRILWLKISVKYATQNKIKKLASKHTLNNNSNNIKNFQHTRIRTHT